MIERKKNTEKWQKFYEEENNNAKIFWMYNIHSTER